MSRHLCKTLAPIVAQQQAAAGVRAAASARLHTQARRNAAGMSSAASTYAQQASKAVPLPPLAPSAGGSQQQQQQGSSRERLLLAAGALSTLLAAGVSLLEGEEYADLRSRAQSRLADVRALLGLEAATAQCAGAAAGSGSGSSAALNFETGMAAVRMSPVVGDDHELASKLRRLMAWLLDSLLVKSLEASCFVLLQLLERRPNWQLDVQHYFQFPMRSYRASVLLDALAMLAWELVWMSVCDGRTPGKWALGIKTVRQDFQPLSASTLLLHAGSHAVITPLIDVVPMFTPNFIAKRVPVLNEAKRDLQALHNMASGTIVVRTEMTHDEEDDE